MKSKSNNPAKLHDYGYRRLFSSPAIMRELLQGFVPLEWVRDMDFDTLEQVKSSFVRQNYREKESDVIYKVKYKGSEIYIYLLLEFQSTVDRFMALRMLSYIIDLYESIRVSEPKRKTLPYVFPVMLYNGDRKWNAAVSLEKLIEMSEKYDVYLPGFTYFKIAINEFSYRTLAKIRNALSAVFMIENVSKDKIDEVAKVVVDLIKGELNESVKEAVFNWIRRLFESKDIDFETMDKLNEKEVGMALLSLYNQGMQVGIKQGIKQGMEKGKQEGIQLGIKQGMQKGEYRKAIEIVRRMYRKGLSMDIIEETTGLSRDEILKIIKRG